jgi:hypothetical protein
MQTGRARIWARLGAALLMALAASIPCGAQNYPSRQIELVVPFVAGGTTDTVARFISQRLSDQWGQPVIVSNRPGGGGDRHQYRGQGRARRMSLLVTRSRSPSMPACRNSLTTR